MMTLADMQRMAREAGEARLAAALARVVTPAKKDEELQNAAKAAGVATCEGDTDHG